MKRRNFLRGMALAGGYLALRGLFPPGALLPGAPGGRWRGNFPGACLALVRAGRWPASPHGSRTVDVCIVGGGVSGLAAAYRLRDASILVLEHLEHTGGHAIRDQWLGIWYSGAAAYFTEPEPPLDALYEELGLPLMKIAE